MIGDTGTRRAGVVMLVVRTSCCLMSTTTPLAGAIFVTSGVARGVFSYWSPYAVSKAGLEMLVKIYAGEIDKTRVRANLLDPAIVRIRLCARAVPGEDPSRLPPPESIAHAFLALALPACTRNGEVVMASAVLIATKMMS